MATTQPEIILYDLACKQGTCFSPTVWKIRLILNYKKIPYKTIFLEFPDIEPTLSKLGIQLPEVAGTGITGTVQPQPKYTVPAIHHLPSDTKIMDSLPIAKFLEEMYPPPAYPGVVIESALGKEVEQMARKNTSPLRNSIVPREMEILNPRSRAYFRETRERVLGCTIESLLQTPEEEDAAWATISPHLKATNDLILTNSHLGPFILGAAPSLSDFFIAGAMHSARCVDEGVFRRFGGLEGYEGVYGGCEGWMVRDD